MPQCIMLKIRIQNEIFVKAITSIKNQNKLNLPNYGLFKLIILLKKLDERSPLTIL